MSSCSTSTSSSSLKRNFSTCLSSSTTSSSNSTIKEENSLSTHTYFPQELDNVVDIKSLICSFLEPEEAEKISSQDPKLKEALFPVDNNHQNEKDNGSEPASKKQKIIKHTVFREKLNHEYNFATLTSEKIQQLLGPSGGNRLSITLLNKGILFVSYDNTQIQQLWNITNPEMPNPILPPFHSISPSLFCQVQDNILQFQRNHKDRGISEYYRRDFVICELTNDVSNISDLSNIIAAFPDSPPYHYGFCKISENMLAAAAENPYKRENNIIFYNITNPEQPIPITSFTEHTNTVTSLCKISDNLLASASNDCTIKLWDITVSAKPICIATLEGHRKEVSYVMKISDNIIASASNDRTVKLWDITNLDNPLKATFGELYPTFFTATYISKITENIIAIENGNKEIKYWNIGKYIHNSEHPFMAGK